MMGFGDRFRKLNDDDVPPEGTPEDEVAATGDGPEETPEPQPQVDEAGDETAATSAQEPEPEPKARRRGLFSRRPKEMPAEDEVAATADEFPWPVKEPEVEALAGDEAAATSSDEEPEREPKARRRGLFSRRPEETPVEDEIAATEEEADDPPADEEHAPEPIEVEASAEDEAAATEAEGDEVPDAGWDPAEVIEVPASEEAAAIGPESEPEAPREPRRRPFSRRPKPAPVDEEIAATEVEDDDSPTAEQPAVGKAAATSDATARTRRRPFSRRRTQGPAEAELAATTAIDEDARRGEGASLHSTFRRPGGSRGRGGAGGDGIPPLMRAFNLLPEDRRTETRHFQTKPLHLALGALIPVALVAVGLMYLSADASTNDKQAERDELSARVTALRAQQDQDRAQSAVPDAIASQALAAGTAQWTSTVATALSERVSWDRVLQDADRVLPPDTYFETLAAAPGSATAEDTGAESSTTDADAAETSDSGLSRLTITGFAPDHETVAIYLRRVQTLRDVESASLTSTARAGTLGVLRFIIEAEVRPSR